MGDPKAPVARKKNMIKTQMLYKQRIGGKTNAQ